MRRERIRLGDPAPDLPTLPPLAVLTLQRCAFGHRPGDVEAFEALGSDDHRS
jgi:hypothetical protein